MMKGTVTLVTGGASGLGKATAEHFIKLGGFVTICDLATSNGSTVARELGDERCIFVPADVTLEKDVENLLSIIKKAYGRLDYVVNCAGVFKEELVFNSKTKKPHDLEMFSNILKVNVLGTFNVIRIAVGLMKQNHPNADGQRGVIVNTSSIMAFEGQISCVAYSASKAAVAGMTLPLARELAEFGIRVCAIAPGMFDTPNVTCMHDTEVVATALKSIVFPPGTANPTAFAKFVQSIVENPVLNGEVVRLDAGLRLQAGEEQYRMLK